MYLSINKFYYFVNIVCMYCEWVWIFLQICAILSQQTRSKWNILYICIKQGGQICVIFHFLCLIEQCTNLFLNAKIRSHCCKFSTWNWIPMFITICFSCFINQKNYNTLFGNILKKWFRRCRNSNSVNRLLTHLITL